MVGLWVELFLRHDLLSFAAAIALRTFVAAVAVLLLAVAAAGELAQQHVWTKQVAPQIAPKVLPAVFAGMNATVQKVFASSSTGLITAASLLAIWEVSGAIRACMSAFSRIYGTEDDRPWYIRFPVSIAIAVAVLASLVASAFLILGLRHAVHGGWGIPLTVARWIAVVVLLVAAFSVVVRFGPAEPRPTGFATGGAALVVVLWIVQSLIFMWYLRSAANYKSAVGSLTAIYLVTTYYYVGAIVLLVGIEIDELLRHDAEGQPQRGILRYVRGILFARG
jgi:membrane protein